MSDNRTTDAVEALARDLDPMAWGAGAFSMSDENLNAHLLMRRLRSMKEAKEELSRSVQP